MKTRSAPLFEKPIQVTARVDLSSPVVIDLEDLAEELGEERDRFGVYRTLKLVGQLFWPIRGAREEELPEEP